MLSIGNRETASGGYCSPPKTKRRRWDCSPCAEIKSKHRLHKHSYRRRAQGLHWKSSHHELNPPGTACTDQLRSLTGVAALVGAQTSRGYSGGSRPAAERWTNTHLGRSGLHRSVPTTQYPHATNSERNNRDQWAEGATSEHCSMEHARHLSAGAGSAAVETPCACSSKPAKNRNPTPHEWRTTNRKRGGPKFDEIRS